MHRRLPLTLGLLLPLAVGCAPRPPVAPDAEANAMRAAIQAGQVIPIATAIARAEARHGGMAVEAELEQRDPGGRWVWEITLLRPAGPMQEVLLDARTGDCVPAGSQGC